MTQGSHAGLSLFFDRRLVVRASRYSSPLLAGTRLACCLLMVYSTTHGCLYVSCISLKRRTVLLTAAADVVLTTQAPPDGLSTSLAVQLLPTQVRFRVSFPQKMEVYLECPVISIFLTIFLRDAP